MNNIMINWWRCSSNSLFDTIFRIERKIVISIFIMALNFLNSYWYLFLNPLSERKVLVPLCFIKQETHFLNACT